MSTNPGNKKRSIRSIITTIAVIAVLVIAPLGSYIYLKNGFAYRVESIAQLKEPKPVAPEVITFIEKHAPFKKNSRLVYFPGKDKAAEIKVVDLIDRRIVDRERFDIVSFSDMKTGRKLHQIDYIDVSETPTTDIQFLLLDTSNVIRATYAYEPEIEAEILRHLSVVLPMPTRKNIHLKREKD